jgi:dipeptidyl-peptidase-3
LSPYKGFVNPVYELVKDANGTITDIKITYNEGYTEQMLRYSKEYSSLPTYN